MGNFGPFTYRIPSVHSFNLARFPLLSFSHPIFLFLVLRAMDSGSSTEIGYECQIRGVLSRGESFIQHHDHTIHVIIIISYPRIDLQTNSSIYATMDYMQCQHDLVKPMVYRHNMTRGRPPCIGQVAVCLLRISTSCCLDKDTQRGKLPFFALLYALH
jgi:hypothetical protein